MIASNENLRNLPAVHELMESLPDTAGTLPQRLVKRICREVIDEERKRILEGVDPRKRDELTSLFRNRVNRASNPSLERVINATGIILHTAIGRAPMSPEASEAINNVSRGYCVLQWNRETGRRGHRDTHVEGLLTELTGAEAATVVNNNAGATLLVLSALARSREVVVSRGQLVEIGGSFRIPDVMRQSGAVMREVGCTNRTHLRDYREAINENTALLLRVHPSNYRIKGFTGEVSIEDMVTLGNEFSIPVVDDLGSGSVISLKKFGLPPEPTINDSIAAGVSITTSSGDKLIGGPQAGIITGRRELIEGIRKHPLARALRVDKLVLAGLEATLRILLEEPEVIAKRHPLYTMFSINGEKLRKKAEKLASMIKLPEESFNVGVIETASYTGSGSLPDSDLPSWGIAITAPDVEKLAEFLRLGSPAVAARVEENLLKLDVRTLLEGEEVELAELLNLALKALWA